MDLSGRGTVDTGDAAVAAALAGTVVVLVGYAAGLGITIGPVAVTPPTPGAVTPRAPAAVPLPAIGPGAAPPSVIWSVDEGQTDPASPGTGPTATPPAVPAPEPPAPTETPHHPDPTPTSPEPQVPDCVSDPLEALPAVGPVTEFSWWLLDAVVGSLPDVPSPDGVPLPEADPDPLPCPTAGSEGAL